MQNINSVLRYTPMGYDEIFDWMVWLEEMFNDFLTVSGYPSDLSYFVSRRDLVDMICRVDKRKAYYCFHGMEIHEKKEVALFAYT